MLYVLQHKSAVQLSDVLNLGEFVLDEVVVILQALAIDLKDKVHLTRHVVALLYFFQCLDLLLKLLNEGFVVVSHGYLAEGRHRQVETLLIQNDDVLLNEALFLQPFDPLVNGGSREVEASGNLFGGLLRVLLQNPEDREISIVQ